MANDVYELVIGYTGGGQYFTNVPHFEASVSDSVDPGGDAQALITAFLATMQTPLLACLAGDVSLLGYKARRVNNGGGPSVINVAAGGTLGTFGSTIDNTRVAALMTSAYLNTPGTPPRWRVGKIFLGGYAETAQKENQWLAPFVTAVGAFGTALESDASASPGPFSAGIWSPTYDMFFEGTAWDLQPETAALKRRIKPYF